MKPPPLGIVVEFALLLALELLLLFEMLKLLLVGGLFGAGSGLSPVCVESMACMETDWRIMKTKRQRGRKA